MRQADSRGTSRGIGTAWISLITVRSASDEVAAKFEHGSPRNVKGSLRLPIDSRQRVGCPVLQARHIPQLAMVDTTTWSPGRTSVTDEPTSSTTPAPSWPMAAGAGQGIVPSSTDRSVWHRPAATMRTTTSRGPGRRSSRSSLSSALPSPTYTNPRMAQTATGPAVGARTRSRANLGHAGVGEPGAPAGGPGARHRRRDVRGRRAGRPPRRRRVADVRPLDGGARAPAGRGHGGRGGRPRRPRRVHGGRPRRRGRGRRPGRRPGRRAGRRRCSRRRCPTWRPRWDSRRSPSTASATWARRWPWWRPSTRGSGPTPPSRSWSTSSRSRRSCRRRTPRPTGRCCTPTSGPTPPPPTSWAPTRRRSRGRSPTAPSPSSCPW